tara:strand:- start:1084 stop:1848 length:765 start_codon:yes stop_codon:yes gene_type:complete
MKLVSWNVNGIRAAVKKDFINSLEILDTDVLCLQETKAQDDQVLEALIDVKGYHIYSNSAIKKGYSGTAIITKTEPIKVTKGIDIEEFDDEGRVLTAEFEKFILVTVYTPNSQNGLKRIEYRQAWDKAFEAYMVELNKIKPVVVCGDLNVAHQAIDIKNDKSNYNKTSGYTQIEIDGLSSILSTGFIDSYRFFKPEEVKYSWWSYRFDSRSKNTGWRLDYFLISEQLKPNMVDAEIHNDIFGSDHCPVSVTLKF